MCWGWVGAVGFMAISLRQWISWNVSSFSRSPPHMTVYDSNVCGCCPSILQHENGSENRGDVLRHAAFALQHNSRVNCDRLSHPYSKISYTIYLQTYTCVYVQLQYILKWNYYRISPCHLGVCFFLLNFLFRFKNFCDFLIFFLDTHRLYRYTNLSAF